MKTIFKLFFKLALLVLAVGGGYLLVSEIKRNKKKYQTLLDDGLENAEETFKEVKEKLTPVIKSFPTKRVVTKPVAGTKLSARQNVIYAIIKGKKTVDMQDLLKRVSGVTERTLRRDLLKLQELNLISKHGNTKAVTYTLN